VRAIDTNVIVRFLTADDPQQACAARQIFESGDLFIGTTVLLECVWVLRAGHGFAPVAIADALRRIGGLPGVTLEEPDAIAQALDWMTAGLDFADALHLARVANCTAFITFDRKLAKRAKSLEALDVLVA
jgi:predicted nucleic-acid-binding protein